MGGMIPPDAPEEQWHRESNLTNTAPFHTKYVAENWPHDIPMYIADTYLGLQVHPTTGLHRFISSPDGPHTLLRRPVDGDEGIRLADYIDDILLLRGGDAGDGVFRDEFTAERGGGSSETLQDRRGWTKAGAANSAILIDASSGDLYDEKARYVQFNGNSSTSPYNVQVKEFGSNDIRVRARVMVTQSDGYAGLCVRSDAGDNALGLNLRIQPGSRSLRLYNNDSPLAQTRTLEPAHEFILHAWYTIDLQVKGDRLVGRLCSDYNGRTLLEQVVMLESLDTKKRS